MNRPIKFRAWDKEKSKMETDVLVLSTTGVFIDSEDYSVMQFTGLKDKNGKEIYEGDVVLIENERFVVEWGLRAWEFVRPDRRGEYQHGEITPLGADTEVIGNIYENSDLLV